jgi:predicted nucleic acid-binding protein
MIAVDTNVLVYAHDPRESEKRARALELIGSIDDGVLLWQVACEYLSVTRKLIEHGFEWKQAWEELERLRGVWSVLLPDWSTFEEARRLMTRYSLSFWDALLLGACKVGGVRRIYTEDFSGYAEVAGVEIVNPFETEGQVSSDLPESP